MAHGNARAAWWYLLRTTLARRRGGYLSLVVLIGLVGGLALGSVAAARRTQSSFPVYLQSTHPFELGGISSFFSPGNGPDAVGYNPGLVAAIARLPHVTSETNQSGLNVIPLDRRGAPQSPAAYPAGAGEAAGVSGDVGANHLGLTVVTGRALDPDDPDQFVVSAATARAFGFHVGEVVRFGAYTDVQTESPRFGTSAVAPHAVFEARLVAVVVQSGTVVEDQVDAPSNANLLAFTPARTRPLLSCCAYFTGTGVDVAGGIANVRQVQAQITHLLPPGAGPFAYDTSGAIEAKAERAIKPESIALGTFGVIAGLAALLIAGQMIGRQLRRFAADRATMRAVGAGVDLIVGDGVIGTVAAVVLGTVAAMAVAVGLSPLSPLGPARPVYPYPGVAFDWTVLGLGAAALVVILGATTVVLAWRSAPHRASAGAAPGRPSAVARAAARAGLSAAAVTGVRFALDPGEGANPAPVRSAVLGTTLALVALVGTVTFGASLDTLVTHPALYGWNWDYELSASQGGVMPGVKTAHLLDADREVGAWSPILFDAVRLGSLPAVPVIGEDPRATVAPPLLSGHGVDGPGQVVVGTVTLAELHAHLGDVLVLDDGQRRTSVKIVGTVTMPTIGVGGNQHPEMGTGAVVARGDLPANLGTSYDLPGAAPGPDAVLVRFRAGVDQTVAYRSLQSVAAKTSTPADYGVTVDPVQRPAEIINYRSMGATPAILGGGLALGALSALTLTLTSSVRRRRHDLAVLKTMGLTRRQLAAVVSWQSSVAVLVGVVVGVPLGIVAGRTLWDLFAHEISVVPAPTVPTAWVVAIAVGALVLANVVAAVPARMAARTPTGVLLRAE